MLIGDQRLLFGVQVDDGHAAEGARGVTLQLLQDTLPEAAETGQYHRIPVGGGLKPLHQLSPRQLGGSQLVLIEGSALRHDF